MLLSDFLVVSLFFVNVLGNFCRIEHHSSQGSAYNSQCPDSVVHGCAVVKKLTKNIHEKPDVHYQCLGELARLHPLFVDLECPYSHEHALCYDDDSTQLIKYGLAHTIKFMEQTVGEVLKLHGIEKFCCCKGKNCNQVNRVIEDTINPPKYVFGTYDEDNQWQYSERSKSEIRQRQYGHNNGIIQIFSYVLVTFLLML